MKSVTGRDVRRELLPGQSPALLRELHLLTRTGDLNADARRKLKQINHFFGLLQPALDAIGRDGHAPLAIDAGAGNAYLGFVLHELWLGPLGRGDLWSVEARPELAAQGEARQARLGVQRMRFVTRQVADLWPAPGTTTVEGRRVDAVVALHACDTATDDALVLGIRAEAAVIAVVPCCQAEVARQLSGADAALAGIGTLWRHGLHRREFGAHLTNVLRALVLESHGYEVTVTELVGWEHSAKNELILGRKTQRGNPMARRQLDGLLATLPPLRLRLLTALRPADH